MIKDILLGIKSYSGAFKLIRKLRLWRYFGIPIAISFLTAVLIGFSSWKFGFKLGGYISKIWIWEWGSEVFSIFSEFIGFIIVLATGLLVYRHIVMAFSSPFMGPVSEKIEKHLYGKVSSHRKSTIAAQLWRGIRINLRNLLLELILMIPILLLSLIPVFGIFASISLFFVQAYYAGFGSMDYTLERYYKYDESIKFVKNNRGHAVGNGIIFIIVLFIPLIGIILVLPLAVTAASVQTLGIIHRDKIPKVIENIS